MFLLIPKEYQVYKSNHNFTTEVSDDWLIFTKDTMAKNREKLEIRAKDIFKIDEKTLSYVKQSVSALSNEYLFYKNKSNNIPNVITVITVSFEKQNLSQKVTGFCEKLPALLNNNPLAKKRFTVNYCKLKKIDDVQTITYSYEDTKEAKTIRYDLNTKTETIGININCGYEHCEKIKKATEKMIEKIEFI